MVCDQSCYIYGQMGVATPRGGAYGQGAWLCAGAIRRGRAARLLLRPAPLRAAPLSPARPRPSGNSCCATAMAALTVKAYLLGKEEAAREIRRFSLQPPLRYQAVCERVAELFQGLLRAGSPPAFRLHYRGEGSSTWGLWGGDPIVVGGLILSVPLLQMRTGT